MISKSIDPTNAVNELLTGSAFGVVGNNALFKLENVVKEELSLLSVLAREMIHRIFMEICERGPFCKLCARRKRYFEWTRRIMASLYIQSVDRHSVITR